MLKIFSGLSISSVKRIGFFKIAKSHAKLNLPNLRKTQSYSFCTRNSSRFLSEIEDVIEIGEKKKYKGKLTVCPTPIGNIKDISIRQYEELLNCDIIACEDTRVTGKLLKMFRDKRIKEKFYDNFEINLKEIKEVPEENNDNISDPNDEETQFFDELELDPIEKKKKKILEDLDTLNFMGKYEHNSDFHQDSDLYGIADEFILYLKKKIKELKEKKGRGLLISYYKHNEDLRLQKLVKAMQYGLNIVLVSDAGTPALCDPGFKIVNECYKHNISVMSLPGPTAIGVALSSCGFPTDRFLFEGYLSKTASIKTDKLEKIKEQRIAVVLFESNNRILKTLLTIEKIYGEDQMVAVGIELTKFHEKIIRGRVRDVYEKLNEEDESVHIRGEVTLVIAPYTTDFNKGLERRKEMEENGELINEDQKLFEIKGENLVKILVEKLDTSDKALANLVSDILNIPKTQAMKLIHKERHTDRPLEKWLNKTLK